MSDQAQGLRALANQVRGDQSVSSAPSSTHPADFYASRAVVRPFSDPIQGGYEDGSASTRDPFSPIRSNAPHTARIIAITSGKGGVGKSNFSTNLSITLSQQGERVVVLDADLGLANLHLLMGTTPPYSLEHVMEGKKTITEVIHPGPAGTRLIAGGSGITDLANLSPSMRATLIGGLHELDSLCDLIVIDTGAGIARNVLAFLCAVNEVIVIATPEPTAITDAYATIKVVSQENPGARLMLVVNMVNSTGEGDAVAERLSTITRQFLGVEIEYLGCIPYDQAVGKAVRNRIPFVLGSPGSSACSSVHRITRNLGYSGTPDGPGGASAGPAGVNSFLNRIQGFFAKHSAR